MGSKIVLCIESSHSRGMGHLFRGLNFIDYFSRRGYKILVLINDNEIAKEILKSKEINFRTVDLNDLHSNWEKEIIQKENILVWINDRLDTEETHSKNVTALGCKLINFDDRGSGAKYSDLGIYGLAFIKDNTLGGQKVLYGSDYLILNPEIDRFKRKRSGHPKSILVTLGGSDTYGVTLKIISKLKKLSIEATIIIGPSFQHLSELESICGNQYLIKQTVPSMIEEFSYYDLAITGGGITPFEANASGLPTLVVANEIHEIPNGEYLQKLGSSRFLGFHENFILDASSFDLDIESMSKQGLAGLDTKGIERIYKEIDSLQRELI